MPKQYTANFKEKTGSTSGEEPLYLVEITHPQLAVPVRYVRDTDDLVSNGNTFFKAWFDVVLPDDVSGKLPRAPIRFDNVGKELTQLLDQSKGGKGAQIRVMQVMRDDPDTVEYDITCDLLHTRQSVPFIVGEIGYEDILNLQALVASYRPDTAPGIF